MKGSSSTRATLDVAMADDVAKRAAAGGLVFSNLKQALDFYWREGEVGQGQQTNRPPAKVRVQGGKGNDPHELHATLLSIHAAMMSLQVNYPRSYLLLVLYMRESMNMEELAKHSGLAISTVSVKIGEAKVFLHGHLTSGGVIVAPRRR